MDDLDLWLGQIDECGIDIRFLFATINAYYTNIARQLKKKATIKIACHKER
jgi:hypothetical protein